MPTLDSTAEWFLRLNGFFTVLNFVVHPVEPDEGTVQRTDADVLGIRFPHRQEIVGGNPLIDHAAFQDAARPIFVIAEVKTGRCSLNGPWSRREDENVLNVLRSFGNIAPVALNEVAEALYQNGRFQSEQFEARLLCFGASSDPNLSGGVLQFTWDQVFGFIYDRYKTFWRVKRQNQQWPPIGRFLWNECKKENDRDAYVRSMLAAFKVPKR
jgi:hypothetical protein